MRAQLGRIVGLQVAVSVAIALAYLVFHGANAATGPTGSLMTICRIAGFERCGTNLP